MGNTVSKIGQGIVSGLCVVAGIAVTVLSGGLAAPLGGALVGAGAAGLTQVITDDDADWGDWGEEFGKGALRGVIPIPVLGDVAGQMMVNAIEGKPIETDLGMAALMGALTAPLALVGGGARSALKSGVRGLKGAFRAGTKGGAGLVGMSKAFKTGFKRGMKQADLLAGWKGVLAPTKAIMKNAPKLTTAVGRHQIANAARTALRDATKGGMKEISKATADGIVLSSYIMAKKAGIRVGMLETLDALSESVGDNTVQLASLIAMLDMDDQVDPATSDFYWIDGKPGMPEGAVRGGNEADGTPLYVCRAEYSGSLCPGKARSDWDFGNFPFDGREVQDDDFQVLVAKEGAYVWKKAERGEIPPGALVMGGEKDGTTLFCARVNHAGGVHCGKAAQHLLGARIPYGGDEISFDSYEVLCVKENPGAESELRWLPYDGNVPANAIVGGNESNGQKLYVSRAEHGGGIHPGKTRSDWDFVNIPYGGKEFQTDGTDQILVGDSTDLIWKAASNGDVPAGAILTGLEGSGEALYTARAPHDGGMHSGKIGLHLPGAHISYGGSELIKTDYEVLCFGTDEEAEEKEAESLVIEWRDSDPYGSADGAVPGGREANGQILYVARADHNDGGISTHPGKFNPTGNCMNIPYGGAEHSKSNFEVLIGDETHFEWKAASGGQIPEGALLSGNELSEQPLYVVRAPHEGGVHIGKIGPHQNDAHISYGGKELFFKNYDVLCIRD